MAWRRRRRGSWRRSRKFGGPATPAALRKELVDKHKPRPKGFEFVLVPTRLKPGSPLPTSASVFFDVCKRSILEDRVYTSLGKITLAPRIVVLLIQRKDGKWLKPVLRVYATKHGWKKF